MPQYIVMRVDDIPPDGGFAAGTIHRLTANTEQDAVQAVLTSLRESASRPAILGVTLASGITRYRADPPGTPPSWTVTAL